MTSGAERPASEPGDWFGQPRGLTILFLTEAWEKFSFYGMRTILIYYMVKQLTFDQGGASLIYGLYTAGVSMTPFFGGFLSDRWLGARRSVAIGGLIMAVGHFMMAFDALLIPALATIAIGSGFYSPNLPAQVAPLYAPEDPRGRSAINVYYLGVNFGAFFAPFVVGTLGEVYGWHYGFAAAGIGMLAGLGIYLAGQRYLPPAPPKPKRSDPVARAAGLTPARLLLLLAVVAPLVIYRACYEQLGNTFPLWADSGVDRRIGSFTIPMTWFISLNPLIIFTFTPMLVSYWTKRTATGRDQGTARKMAFGAVLLGASFLLLAIVAAASTARGHKASWLWVVAFFLVYTLGELHTLPVGLGLVARIAPVGLAATTIAIYGGQAFLGNLFGGFLGGLWGRLSPAMFFGLVAVACLVSAGALAMLKRVVQAAEQDAERVRLSAVEARAQAGPLVSEARV